MAKRKDAEPKATEHEMLNLLERLHAKTGNGGSGEYAFMRHVRNDGSFDATRTFDAVAVGLWKSRGYTIHIYEVKVSRSDWKRELAKPDKAEDACKVADYFTIVAPKGVVDIEDLPPTWGLIEASGGVAVEEEEPSPIPGQFPVKVTRIEGRKLRTVKKAPLLSGALNDVRQRPLPRGLVVSMLRASGAVPDRETPTEKALKDAENRGWESASKSWSKTVEESSARAQEYQGRMYSFVQGSGLRDLQYADRDKAREMGERVRVFMADESRAMNIRKQTRDLAAHLRRYADGLDAVAQEPRVAAEPGGAG